MTDDYWAARRTAFGSAADDYALGRPVYPLDALRWVVPQGAKRVLDLAAGTGRVTERLLELGLDVVAVEPLPEMRVHVPRPALALDGKAEAIPLDDASVDAVVVGQAFHWFDIPAALAEIARVLRPGGRLGLMWNLLDDSDPWVDALAASFEADERASHMPIGVEAPYPATALLGAPERRVFRHTDTYDVDRMLRYVRSRSFTILMPPVEQQQLLDRVAAHFDTSPVDFPLVCEVWRGDRLAG